MVLSLVLVKSLMKSGIITLSLVLELYYPWIIFALVLNLIHRSWYNPRISSKKQFWFILINSMTVGHGQDSTLPGLFVMLVGMYHPFSLWC